MKRSNDLVGIAVNDPKLAALFCDKIVQVSPKYDPIPESIALPDVEHIVEDAYAHVAALTSDEEIPIQITEIFYNRFRNSRAVYIQKRLSDIGIVSVPFFTDSGTFNAWQTEGGLQSIILEMTNVPIIDTGMVKWEHVLDLRRDINFGKKLRSLRLLFTNEYAGKDAAYIKDDIESRIDAYKEECRINGLKYRLSIYKQVLNSKSLIGSIAIGAVAILTGNPEIGAVISSSGCLFEVGKMAIALSEKHLDIQSKSSNLALSYLMELREYTDGKKMLASNVIGKSF